MVLWRGRARSLFGCRYLVCPLAEERKPELGLAWRERYTQTVAAKRGGRASTGKRRGNEWGPGGVCGAGGQGLSALSKSPPQREEGTPPARLTEHPGSRIGAWTAQEVKRVKEGAEPAS